MQLDGDLELFVRTISDDECEEGWVERDGSEVGPKMWHAIDRKLESSGHGTEPGERPVVRRAVVRDTCVQDTKEAVPS